MKQITLSTEQIKSIQKRAFEYNIKELIPEYSKYSISEIQHFIKYFNVVLSINIRKDYMNNDLIKLTQQLQKAIISGNEIYISVKSPYKNSAKMSITSQTLIHTLHSFCNTLLNESMSSTFQEKLHLQPKERMSTDSNIFNFTVPYTTDEFKKIIAYQKKSTSIFNNYDKKNKIQGPILQLINKYRNNKIFDTSLKTIATNEACFIYDTLTDLDIIEDESFSHQDKYKAIQRFIPKDYFKQI